MSSHGQFDGIHLSYSHTVSIQPYVYQTVGQRLHDLAKLHPQKTAFVFRLLDDKIQRVNFGELFSYATAFAKRLRRIGVETGDKVVVFAHNSKEWAIAEFGVMLAGGVPVNCLDITVSDVAVEAKCSVLILDLRCSSLDKSVEVQLRSLKEMERKNKVKLQMIGIFDEDIQETKFEGFMNFHEVLSRTDDSGPGLPSDVYPECPSLVFETSGSTGEPKILVHSHQGILSNAAVFCDVRNLRADDIFFCDRPLGYAAGFPLALLALGCTTVTVDSRITVGKNKICPTVMEFLCQEGITCGYFAPYLVHDLVKRQPGDIPNLRVAITGGQKLSKELLCSFEKFADIASLGYGTSESMWITFAQIEHLRDESINVLGRPLPGVEVKLVDESHQPVHIGETEELCVKSPSVALGKNGRIETLVDNNGWLHTGDLATMDTDGVVFFKGRIKEVIFRGGLKIYPGDIEHDLSQHPGISRVKVIGIPDARLNQEIVACIVLKHGQSVKEESIRKYAETCFVPKQSQDGRGLMPKFFFTMEAFPMLQSGKVDMKSLENGVMENIKISSSNTAQEFYSGI